ncbi:translation protein SH3-like domain-containing protein [Protomyces lactucae-debilis]|uniref:Translation protein SH3-like domain-containing protein n=1 Tax=Protomyces lactucae-debilis TaxID=2754530 RepID=A0A1Y2FNL1_PROLT|nr:translation protein SH3-like domain-containing protein [Protomyces lactucae-debilis]ORY85581.1 translation protein SH3-like domain-containing protein [Protomyces lactucae-debilis]
MKAAKKAVKPRDRIKFWNIAVGDTVRVITGPQRGTTGRVIELHKERNKITVGGVNIIKKTLPLFLSSESGLETQKFEYAAPIHYSNVQLVGDIPVTLGAKETRSVVVKRVLRGKTFFNKDKKMLTWRRWIPGENLFLPWPKREQDEVSGPMDTTEAEVSANTYLETLYASPVPTGLEDELRNKYSRFTREKRERAALSEVPVAEVEGIEEDVAAPKRYVPKNRDPLKGLSPAAIDTLAQSMKRL